jgi:hypothetical protein
MTEAEIERRDNFLALLARYNQLGRLLPTPGDLDYADAAQVAEAEIIIG